MDPRQHFLFHFTPVNLPEFVSASTQRSTRNEVRFFKGVPPHWAQPPEYPQFPTDPPPKYAPLSDREKLAYACMAIVGCVPFLLLIGIYILAHSPLFAN